MGVSRSAGRHKADDAMCGRYPFGGHAAPRYPIADRPTAPRTTRRHRSRRLRASSSAITRQSDYAVLAEHGHRAGRARPGWRLRHAARGYSSPASPAGGSSSAAVATGQSPRGSHGIRQSGNTPSRNTAARSHRRAAPTTAARRSRVSGPTMPCDLAGTPSGPERGRCGSGSSRPANRAPAAPARAAAPPTRPPARGRARGPHASGRRPRRDWRAEQGRVAGHGHGPGLRPAHGAREPKRVRRPSSVRVTLSARRPAQTVDVTLKRERSAAPPAARAQSREPASGTVRRARSSSNRARRARRCSSTEAASGSRRSRCPDVRVGIARGAPGDDGLSTLEHARSAWSPANASASPRRSRRKRAR